MSDPRSVGRALGGGILVLAVFMGGLPGFSQSVTFSGHVYLGVAPDRAVPATNITIELHGDNDAFPDNGLTQVLAQVHTDSSGAFLLQWTPLRLTYACFHVRVLPAEDHEVASVQAPPPGIVSDMRTITYLDVPVAAYADIEFWMAPTPGPPSTSPLADLVVTAFEIDPLPLAPGDHASLNASIRNQGAAEASAFSVRFFIDGTPIPATLSIGGLSPGANAAVGTSASNLDAGAHVLEVAVDSAEDVSESDETNNTATVSIMVGETAAPPRMLPDLEITSVDVAPRIAPQAADRTCTCTVANVGNARADETTLIVTGARMELLANLAIPSLDAGERITLSTSLLTSMLGEQQVSLHADPNDIVRETDEQNNTAAIALWTLLDSHPDLVVSEISAEPSATGILRRFTVRVENRGTANAGAFAVGLYAGSVPVSALSFADGLPFDSSIEVVLFTSSDRSNLAAVADPDGWVTESDETNNAKVWFAAPQLLADVVIDHVSVVSDPETTGSITAFITIRNAGSATAENVQLLFALVDPLQLDAGNETADTPWLYRFVLADLPDLSAGEIIVWPDTWSLDPSAPRLRLVASLDPFGLVEELDRTNNDAQQDDFSQGGE